MLLELFEIDQIRSIWERYVVVQDDWFHASNVWAAKNLFMADDPEQFVKEQLRKARKLHMAGQLSY
jgi:hypothetical protein